MLATNEVTMNLIRARELIADEKNWCQYRLYDGNKHCALGALMAAKINSSLYLYATTLLNRAAVNLYGRNAGPYFHMAAVIVNNTLGHAATLAMFDRAIEMSLEGEPK